jgi:hypothetical protein
MVTFYKHSILKGTKMKKRIFYAYAASISFTFLLRPTLASTTDANIIPPVVEAAGNTETSPIFLNPSAAYLQCLNQQVNLGSSGTKLTLDMAGRIPFKDKQSGLILGFYGGGGPSPSTLQTAALRMLFPADFGLFGTFYHRQNDINAFFLSVDLLASTLPDKIRDSKSTLLFTPGFLAVSLGEIQDVLVSRSSKNSNGFFRYLSIGGRVRFLTALWNQAQVAPLFETTPEKLSGFGTDADYSLWVEVGLTEADIKIQYYNFLGGDIGTLADQGEGGFFKSGALGFTLSKAIDFNTHQEQAPIEAPVRVMLKKSPGGAAPQKPEDKKEKQRTKKTTPAAQP